MFTVEEAATPETLKEILAHFQSGNNVAVSIFDERERATKYNCQKFANLTSFFYELLFLIFSDYFAKHNRIFSKGELIEMLLVSFSKSEFISDELVKFYCNDFFRRY